MSLMHFKSIEVEQFLQFRETVTIEGLDAELNVIAGDNEAGKSTLLQAIRTVLFNRHKGTAGEKFAPYNAKVSPRIKLVFVVDDVEYQLEKVFSKNKEGRTELKADDGKSWDGPDAENYLAELLGFSYAKGQSKPEHQGLAGLLWVEQSKAYESVSLSDQSRQQIHSVFENEMREMLGGGQGEQLHKRIGELRSIYFDLKGNPRGDYKKLQAEVAQVQLQLEEKQLELKAYEDKVDYLERQQKEQASYLADNAEERARQAFEQAQKNHQRISELQKEVEADQEKVKRVEAEAKVASNAWDSRTNLIKDLSTSEQTVKSLQDDVDGKEEEIAPRIKAITEQQDSLTEIKKHRSEIEEKMRRAREIESLQQLSSDFQRLDKTLKEAKKIDSDRRRCIADQDAITITEAVMNDIKKADRQRELTDVRLSNVATRLQYQLQPDITVQLGDNTLTGTGDARLTEATELQLGKMGNITVIPGGDDLQSLQRTLEEQNHQLTRLLAETGLDTVDDASKELQRSQTMEVLRGQYEATLKGLAPDGMQALEDDHSSVTARREKLRTSLGDISTDEKKAAELETKVDLLQQQIVQLEETLQSEEDAIQQLRDDLITTKANAKTENNNKNSLIDQLERLRKESSDDELEKKLTEAEAAVEKAQRSLNALKQALDDSNPGLAENELERTQKVQQQITEKILKLERDIRELKVELTALGQKGLAEEVATLESEYESAKLQLEQSDNHAHALDLLQRTLDTSLQQAKEAIAQPITDKLLPYLRQLIPGAAPLINEELILTGIQREGIVEPFENLSIGTREQVAVLVRLAYADLLSAEGVPVMVILDDALVNSDDDRRDRMKTILYQASKRYQILLLTCHEKAYRDSGGKLIRLE